MGYLKSGGSLGISILGRVGPGKGNGNGNGKGINNGKGNTGGGQGGNGSNGGLGGGGGNVSPTNLFSAYSLKKIVSAYGGSSIRVRRSSDNTEQDIGFANGVLNTSSLLSFVGLGDGFVKTFYDQSGNGNNLSNSTAAQQPKIVSSGTYLGQLFFDGVDDNLVTTASIAASTGRTCVWSGRFRDGEHAGVYSSGTTITENVFGTATISTGIALWKEKSTFSGNYVRTLMQTKSDGNTMYTNAQCQDNSNWAAVWDTTAGTLGGQLTFYAGSSAQTSQGSPSLSGTSTGNYAADTIWLGGTASGNFAQITVESVVLYARALNSSEVASTQSIIGTPAYSANVFDSFTTGMWGLYSLRKQLTSYAGSCIRVRRSSDNAEQDIGFVSNTLDTASLLSFVGAGNGFVKTFYDQSGNSRDFSQATTTKQPKIVNSGALVSYGVLFDGIDDCLQTSVNCGAVSQFTYFIKADGPTANGSTSVLLETGVSFVTDSGNIISFDSNKIASGTAIPTGSSYYGAHSSYNRQVYAVAIDRTQALVGDQTKQYLGGVFQTTTDQLASGTPFASGPATAKPYTMGARNGGASLPFAGGIDTVAIFETTISASNIDLISRNLG